MVFVASVQIIVRRESTATRLCRKQARHVPRETTGKWIMRNAAQQKGAGFFVRYSMNNGSERRAGVTYRRGAAQKGIEMVFKQV